MKKTFLWMLLLSSCTATYTDKTLQDFESAAILSADDVVVTEQGECLDANRVPVTGTVRFNVSDGTMLSRIVSGHRDGTTRLFAANGRLIAEMGYKDNLLNGISRTYYANGYIAGETDYKDGIKNGTETRYMGEPFWGRKQDETTYVNGIKHGPYTRYGGSSKSYTKYYNNGVLDGPYTSFFPNGEVMRTEVYVNGLRQGKTVSYHHRHGGISREGSLVDDLMDGTEKYYDRSGRLTMEIRYDKGQIVPPVIGYYPDGGRRFVIEEVRTSRPHYRGYCLTPQGERARDFDEREEKYAVSGVDLWGCGEFR